MHGSGPQDLDETIGANKPFRDLAWGLAARGIAVLRYEKRTLRYALVAPVATVQDEVIDDAVAAIARLREQPEVDSRRLFVVGHSLGGGLVPRIADAARTLSGGIILAGNSRPLQRVLQEQIHARATDAAAAPMVALVDDLVARLEKGTLDPRSSWFGAPGTYWIDVARHDNADAASRSNLPLLILWGERDAQVGRADFDLWKEVASRRGGVDVRSLPKLNHLFIAGSGEPSVEEYSTPGSVDAAVMDAIAAFIAAQQRR